jgi:undecaprenyl-diphosphatase
MTEVQAVILGIVQGVTEFLPISSTAHLRIVPVLLGWKDAEGNPLDPGAAFTAVTQWGTWLATVIYFRHDLARILLAWWRGLVSGRPFADHDSRLAWMIAAATVPIVVLGLSLKKYIKGPFRSNWVIAGALIGLAVLLVVAELVAAWRRKRSTEKDLEHVGWFEAMFIGFAQAVALVPGASRSGSTITGALFVGLDRPTAARFSFLLSLPAIFGAGLYSLYKDWDELTASRSDAVNLILATVVAGVVGYASIALLIRYLKTYNTAVFIVYRIALGVALLVMLWRGVIAP